uniref:BCAR3 adaptor protein, NSP family member n=1 Tax=Tetraodon nigroviridis TaxID=99883 RepID=H3D453_TETNG
QFSRDQFILECSSEKLRKELEEELKMDCEELRSHAWYHGAIPRQVAENLVQRDGDFLIRDSLSSPGSYVLTSQWRNTAQHFKINKKVVALNEAYTRVEFRLEREGFDSVPALIRFYVGNRKPVSQVVGAIIFQPINRAVPLRCLEERYGLSNNHRERLMTQERRSQKRLSLNISNGHAHDGGHAGRMKDRCGSQPASLNQVHDRRRPLKAHQSESYLPLGSKPQAPPPADSLPLSPTHKSPVFRTGSEPVLSPSLPRRSAELLSGHPMRGSDGQLCPKPPPKPSKVLLSRLSPPSDSARLAAPPPDPPCGERRVGSSPAGAPPPDGAFDLQPPRCSHAERLRREELGEGEAGGRSSYRHAIASSGSSSEEEQREEGRKLVETESTFRPADFGSRLLPAENKPLEVAVLRRAKELLLSHDHRSIARHLLQADCRVARILGVSPQLRAQMGVASGLELVTLPHGHQLRLDLMERHHTMAIGVAVDILGCTGSVEERATTLNRIILVAVELKDAVGDLFAFTALMKALDLPHITISRLEETWTTLRRNYTQTAISYEKTLKPFFKNLYEGTASPPPTVCVPVLLPLLTLMERSSTSPEGAELWETNDQGCDILLHLEAARGVAHNAQSYRENAENVLDGFGCDEELLEVLKTDFQLRLLWGSRGASVNQSDRYNKFNLILTALSRKLEPPPKIQTVI